MSKSSVPTKGTEMGGGGGESVDREASREESGEPVNLEIRKP